MVVPAAGDWKRGLRGLGLVQIRWNGFRSESEPPESNLNPKIRPHYLLYIRIYKFASISTLLVHLKINLIQIINLDTIKPELSERNCTSLGYYSFLYSLFYFLIISLIERKKLSKNCFIK